MDNEKTSMGSRMSDQAHVPLEKMTTVELTMWLQSKGFGATVQSAFEGQCVA